MKITKVLAIASLLSLAAAGSSFAAAITATNTAGGDMVIAGTPQTTVKPSKNVLLKYVSGGTVTGSGMSTYIIQSIHASGTKQYGSSSGDTKIFMQDNTTGAIAGSLAAPATGSSMDATGWTAM